MKYQYYQNPAILAITLSFGALSHQYAHHRITTCCCFANEISILSKPTAILAITLSFGALRNTSSSICSLNDHMLLHLQR